MNIFKQLMIVISIFSVIHLSCMDKPLADKQESSSLSEQVSDCYARVLINDEALRAYRDALSSPAIDGLTDLQKAKQYLKAQIDETKKQIKDKKVEVNFDFLANLQIPDEEKYDRLCYWEIKVEEEVPLRTELASLKLAYSFVKIELRTRTKEQIKEEIKSYYPPIIRS